MKHCNPRGLGAARVECWRLGRPRPECLTDLRNQLKHCNPRGLELCQAAIFEHWRPGGCKGRILEAWRAQARVLNRLKKAAVSLIETLQSSRPGGCKGSNAGGLGAPGQSA